MEMSIDKAIDIMERYEMYVFNSQKDGRNKAIDIMRKYQKIEQIINKWNVGIYDDEGLCDAEVLEMISDEVLIEEPH